MALAFDKPLICPTVIGREGEVASLEQALAQVRSGAGQTVLIAGEPGIGKSRLAAVARARAETLEFRCLQGHCLEADAALPFAPLTDLLRAYVASMPPGALADNPNVAAPELGRLLPEMATLRPDMSAPPAWREPEQEKQ